MGMNIRVFGRSKVVTMVSKNAAPETLGYLYNNQTFTYILFSHI